MGRELDALVLPLGSPIVAGDEARSVNATEAAVDERVPRLRLVGSAVREPEVPVGVFVRRRTSASTSFCARGALHERVT
jgi:hypothetical protein